MLRVTAAIIRDETGRILVARRAPGRSMAGFWEFPGGKIEPGETPADCLRRELQEELGIDSQIGPELARSIHRYDWGPIELIAHEVRWVAGRLTPSDHDRIDWVLPPSLLEIGLAPADLPIARALVDRMP
jgi:8-oxo-dGTP diphosphatase